jgi:hypothetical protein
MRSRDRPQGHTAAQEGRQPETPCPPTQRDLCRKLPPLSSLCTWQLWSLAHTGHSMTA